MEDLGAANAVEDFDAEAILESVVQCLGQRLAGGNREPDAGEVEVFGLAAVREQLAVIRGYGKKEGRLVALDLRVDVRRRRRTGPEDGGCPDRKGKGQRIAKAVGEEKLGDRKRPVGGVDPAYQTTV